MILDTDPTHTTYNNPTYRDRLEFFLFVKEGFVCCFFLLCLQNNIFFLLKLFVGDIIYKELVRKVIACVSSRKTYRQQELVLCYHPKKED